jgi:hypothetical protein
MMKTTKGGAAAKRKKQKPKRRRAPQYERDYAARMAAMYRAGEKIPSGEGERPIDGDDLATLLEWFAEEGTFAPPRWAGTLARKLTLRGEIAELRGQGKSYFGARVEVMDKHKVSEATVDRAVYPHRGGTHR